MPEVALTWAAAVISDQRLSSLSCLGRPRDGPIPADPVVPSRSDLMVAEPTQAANGAQGFPFTLALGAGTP